MHRPDKFIKGLASVILSTYTEVIVPAWKNKQTKLVYKKSLAATLYETQRINIDSLCQEHREWDRSCEEYVI